jgi:hypothetical protein
MVPNQGGAIQDAGYGSDRNSGFPGYISDGSSLTGIHLKKVKSHGSDLVKSRKPLEIFMPL